MKDPEWEFIRAFCNRVLRDGIESEIKNRDKIKEDARAYRYKRSKVIMMKEAYKLAPGVVK